MVLPQRALALRREEAKDPSFADFFFRFWGIFCRFLDDFLEILDEFLWIFDEVGCFFLGSCAVISYTSC